MLIRVHRLARELGMTCGEVETRMSSAELIQWLALDRTEPFPLELDIAALEALAAVASAYSKRPLGAASFLPKLKPVRAQPAAEGLAVMQTLRARMLARQKGSGG